MSSNITQLKRARTPEQKSDRRDTILVTAKTLFMEAGYEGFSMGLLSKRAGVAKGTLYLYFGTKEEVLLSLYSREFERFCTTRAHRGVWCFLRFVVQAGVGVHGGHFKRN